MISKLDDDDLTSDRRILPETDYPKIALFTMEEVFDQDFLGKLSSLSREKTLNNQYSC